MLDFLQTNSSEIITLLITILASILPIPFTIKELIKNYNKANEVKLSKKKLQEDLSKIDISKEKLEELSKILEDVYNTSDTITENFSTVSINHTYTSSKKFSLDELYEKRNTDKFLKKVSFTLAVIMSVIGTVILFIGIIISLFSNKEIGWITTSSGAIIEIVASIYFWLLNRTMKEVKDNSRQLEKTEDLITAIELVEKINDTKIKDETYRNMIDKLLSSNDK